MLAQSKHGEHTCCPEECHLKSLKMSSQDPEDSLDQIKGNQEQMKANVGPHRVEKAVDQELTACACVVVVEPEHHEVEHTHLQLKQPLTAEQGFAAVDPVGYLQVSHRQGHDQMCDA